MVQSQLPLITDPDVVSYIESVGKSILGEAGPQFFKYRFFVIRDEALNAFAAPSGLLFVHSGMIEAMDDENELAGVLAHEIAHVVARHIARRMERMQTVNLLTLAGVLAAVFLGGGGKATGAIATGALATSGALSLKYSREDEEEADRMAFRWVPAAGYDVRGMISVFKKIRRYGFLGSPSIPSYMMTHPALEERIGYLEDLTLIHPTPVVKRDNSALRRCQIRIALAIKSPAELREKWQNELKKNPSDPYLYYAVALTYQAEKQYAQANEYLDKAASLGFPKALLLGEQGVNAFGEGKFSEATAFLKAARESDPNVARYQQYLARAYKKLGNLEEAAQTLEHLKAAFPDYPDPYYDLGLIYGDQKKTGLAEYNLGMYYYLTGDYRSTSRHLAQALADGSMSAALKAEIQRILSDVKKIPEG